jgi:mxaJ protein
MRYLLLSVFLCSALWSIQLSPGSGADQLATPSRARTTLRVVAAPDDLPYSNRAGEGFENRLAELIARELGLELEYAWCEPRSAGFRRSLKRESGDVVFGLPERHPRLLTTAPYYRSTYVFVTRADRRLALSSLDDPRLRRLALGVPRPDGGTQSAAELALARRGIARNVVAIVGDGDRSASERAVEAVADAEVDAALLWGPLAGYFAPRQAIELDLAPLAVEELEPEALSSLAASVGVRRDDPALRDRIDEALERRRGEVSELLERYGVPRVEPSPATAALAVPR